MNINNNNNNHGNGDDVDDNKRKSQTKISFLISENNQLRNENLNFSKLIKLQHKKQDIIQELKLSQYADNQGTEQLEMKKANGTLSKLFQLTMEENKRLLAFISNVQIERDNAQSKIVEGLEYEEISIFESLNNKLSQMSQEILNKDIEIDKLQKIVKQSRISKDDEQLKHKGSQDKKEQEGSEKNIKVQIVQLNAMLEQSLSRLNQKNEQIIVLEDQKKELLLLNSMLIAEIQKQKTSTKKEAQSISQIIADQKELLLGEDNDNDDSSISDDIQEEEVFLNKGIGSRKNNTNQVISFVGNIHNNEGALIAKQHEQVTSMENLQEQKIINLKQISQINGIFKQNRLETDIMSQKTNGFIDLQSQQLNKSNVFREDTHSQQPSEGVISMKLIVPKLDLRKALRVQQLNFKHQLQQENQTQFLNSQQVICEKQKELERKSKQKGLSQESVYQLQQEIQVLEDRKKDKTRMLEDQNNILQEDLKNCQSKLDNALLQVCQQERQIEKLHRELTQAESTNQILIDSNEQYQRNSSKISNSLQFLRQFYESHSNNSPNSTHIPCLMSPQLNSHILSFSNSQCNLRDPTFLSLNKQRKLSQLSLIGGNSLQCIPSFSKTDKLSSINQQQWLQQSYQQSQVNLYFSQHHQIGQKVFDETEDENTVFVPVSLRKDNSNTVVFKDQPQIILQDKKKLPYKSSATFQNQNSLGIPLIFSDDQLSQQGNINNIASAKKCLLSLAQDLYYESNINSLSTQGMYNLPLSPSARIDHTFSFSSRRNYNKDNHLLNKRRMRRSRSHSLYEQKTKEKVKLLPFKCLAKNKNIQPLKIFQSKTLTMHNTKFPIKEFNNQVQKSAINPQ